MAKLLKRSETFKPPLKLKQKSVHSIFPEAGIIKENRKGHSSIYISGVQYGGGSDGSLQIIENDYPYYIAKSHSGYFWGGIGIRSYATPNYYLIQTSQHKDSLYPHFTILYEIEDAGARWREAIKILHNKMQELKAGLS